MFWRIIGSIVVLFPIAIPEAGAIDFLRMTCVPEARYFSVEYKSLNLDEVDGEGASKKEIVALKKAWKRLGYYDPARLVYECRLPDSTYRLNSSQGRSRAAEPCDTVLTLRANDELWLDQVAIGPGCAANVGLQSIEIINGRVMERQPRSVTLCMNGLDASSDAPYCEPYQPHPTQSETQRVTQDDIAEYIAARNAEHKPPSTGGNWKRDARSLNGFLRVLYPCEFPQFQLPTDAVVHVLINGMTTELPFGIDPATSRAYVGDVFVNLPRKRVALVIVGNSGPTVWNFHWTPSTDIVAVAAMASSRLGFAGLPKGTPIFSGHFGSKTACEYFSASPGFTESEKRKVTDFAMQMYHRPPDVVRHFEFSSPASLGEMVEVGNYIQSRDVTVESFSVAASDAIGTKGFEKLERDGMIRKATPQDARQWLASWKVAHPKIAKSYTATDDELLASILMWTAFVVQKPFRYPTGLVGADRGTFFVPAGIPRPTGDLGHSTVYDMNTGTCVSAPEISLCRPF